MVHLSPGGDQSEEHLIGVAVRRRTAVDSVSALVAPAHPKDAAAFAFELVRAACRFIAPALDFAAPKGVMRPVVGQWGAFREESSFKSESGSDT